MKNQYFLLLTAYIILAVLCISCGKKHVENEVVSVPDVTNEQALEAQKHINRYFHREVIPKFNQAWAQLSDSAKAVTYEYTFTRDRDRWIFDKLRSESSSLTASNDSMAFALMSAAATGTVFPTEIFKEDSLLTLYWTWPVPFPEGTFDHEAGTFVAKDNNGGTTGGCDGKGTKAFCKTCKCETVCVGYKICKILPNGCEASHRCASGGPFGSLSGNVIQ